MPRVYNSHSAEQYDLTKSEDIRKLEEKHPGVDTLQGRHFSVKKGHLLFNVGLTNFESSGLPGSDFFTNYGIIELIDRDNRDNYRSEDYETFKDDVGLVKGWRKIKITTDGWFENYPLDKLDFYLRIEAVKNKFYIKDEDEEWDPADGNLIVYEQKLANAKEFEDKIRINRNGHQYLEDIIFTINYTKDFPLFPKESDREYSIYLYNPKYSQVRYSIVVKSSGDNWIGANKPIYLNLGLFRKYIANMTINSVYNYIGFVPKRSTYSTYKNIYLGRYFTFEITGVTKEEIKEIVVKTTVELNHSNGKISKTYDFVLDYSRFNEEISISYNEQIKKAVVTLNRVSLESKIFSHLDKETRTWVFIPMYGDGSTPLELSLNYGDWLPFFDHDSDSNLTGRIKYEMKRVKGSRFYYRIPKLSEQDEAKLWFDFSLKDTSRVKELNRLFLKRVWLANNDTVWSKNIYKKPYEKVKMYGAIYNFPTLIEPEEVEFIFSARHKRRDNGEWVEVDYPCEKLIYDNVYLHNGGNKNRDRWMRDARTYETIQFHFEITDSKGYPLPNDEVNYVRVRSNEYTEGRYGFKFKLKDKYRYRTEFLSNYGTSWFRSYNAAVNELCTSPFLWQFKPYDYYGYEGKHYYEGNIYYDTTSVIPTNFLRNIYSDQSFLLTWRNVFKDKVKKIGLLVKIEQIDSEGKNWITLQEYDLIELLEHSFFKKNVTRSNYDDEQYAKSLNYDLVSSSKNHAEAIKYHSRLKYKTEMGHFWDVILPFPVHYKHERTNDYEVVLHYGHEKYKEEHSWLYKDALPGSTRGIRNDLGNRLRYILEPYAIGKEEEYNDQRFTTFKPWITEFELREIPSIQVYQQGYETRWDWYDSRSSRGVEIVFNFPEQQEILEYLDSVTYVADKDKSKLMTEPEYSVSEDDYAGKTNKYYYARKISKFFQSGDHHWYYRIYDQYTNPNKGKDNYIPIPVSDYYIQRNIKIISDKKRERNETMYQALIPVWKNGTPETVKSKFLELFPEGYFPLKSFKFTEYSKT